MNFGQLNIHELDKSKSYICEAKMTKQIPCDELFAYLKSVKDAFEKVGITNVVFIPTGDLYEIKELTVKKDMSNEDSCDQ